MAPEQDLSNNNTRRHAIMEEENLIKPSILNKELQANKDCWEGELVIPSDALPN